MIESKQKRAKSASLVPHHYKIQNKKRYEKIKTQVNHSFYPHEPNKPSYSKGSLRKDKITRGNLMSSKGPEQMMEQNMNLKMFINNLQEQLSLQRGRLQMNKRKTQKYVKQFNRQFDKELYYSGKNPHSYMFSGIKQQYQNIKQLYEQKCAQFERYAQSVNNTSIEELKICTEQLQQQNLLLREKLQQILAIQERSSSKLKSSMNQKPSEIQKLYYNQQEQQSSGRQIGNNQYAFQQRSETTSTAYYKKKAQYNEKEVVQLKKKITFLQQLIIEKDNNAHKFKREAKKLQREAMEYCSQIKALKEQIEQIQKVSDNKIKSILEKEIKRFEKESNIFKRALVEKDDQIAKLEKQIRFLSTMLSYWKPLDQLNRNQFLGKELDDKQQNFQESKGKKTNKQQQSSQRQLAFESVSLNNAVQNEQQISFKSNREQDFIRRTAGMRTQSHDNVLVLNKERIPQSCSKKSKETAKKCRKVEPYQTKSIGELLRYRLIGNNYDIDNLRKLFDLAESASEQDREFRTQYITMRQIKTVLLNAPFHLQEAEAILVSRYVVEDEACQFVYLDEDNEIKRTIAKSIIKALIGDYSLPDPQDMKRQWQKLKVQYLPNIQSALKIIAPKGVISEGKFIELLVGLGIQLKQDFKDWMIAAMVIKSDSLKELKYRTLIPE